VIADHLTCGLALRDLSPATMEIITHKILYKLIKAKFGSSKLKVADLVEIAASASDSKGDRRRVDNRITMLNSSAALIVGYMSDSITLVQKTFDVRK
jgi:hypothetical protein